METVLQSLQRRLRTLRRASYQSELPLLPLVGKAIDESVFFVLARKVIEKTPRCSKESALVEAAERGDRKGSQNARESRVKAALEHRQPQRHA